MLEVWIFSHLTKSVVILLAVLALIAGFVAVFYWHKASKVLVMPMEVVNGRLQPLSMIHTSNWVKASYVGLEKSGKLNKSAALWTAASIALSAAASVLSCFSS